MRKILRRVCPSKVVPTNWDVGASINPCWTKFIPRDRLNDQRQTFASKSSLLEMFAGEFYCGCAVADLAAGLGFTNFL